MTVTDDFRAARDGLLAVRTSYADAREQFVWPRFERFNWALDWFDRIPARDRVALRVLDESGADEQRTFAQLTTRSNQVANHLRALGVHRGDRMILMLPNIVPLWEVMLAAVKLGVVIIPCTTLAGPEDLADRIERGNARVVVAESSAAPRFAGLAGADIRVAVGPDTPEGWHAYAATAGAPEAFESDGETLGSDTLLLYFTSGTTSKPKLVEHTHTSYPVGHLASMYVIGLQPGDVHLNISSPGWAKHAWSCFFAPWNAEATVFVYNYARFDAPSMLDVLVRAGVTTFCAPPTVWRMLIQQDMKAYNVRIREVLSAGEPLNPEVIEQVERAWGLTIRDFYGQTETTALVGNTPGQPVKPGSMGRPAPGYPIVLVDADGNPSEREGEVCIDLHGERPVGLMVHYRDSPEKTAEAMRGGWYHTGDVAVRDDDGYITYVGRTDDVFKSSDYRISPFELESVLIEHEAVAEAAVVPSPDPVRLCVPKAFVALAAGHEPSAETARAIFAYSRERLAPYKRIRRLQFAELPKTISGKIRRVELRGAEDGRDLATRAGLEWWEDDFADLKGER